MSELRELTGPFDLWARDIIGDLIGVIAIFGGGYAALVIGHGLGL